jgi:hypothetical protein
MATSPEWGVGAKLVFSLGIFGFMAAAVYLLYWGVRVWRQR